MEKKLKKFFFITNPSRDRGLLVTRRLIAYLNARGVESHYLESKTLDAGYYTDASIIPKGTDCVIVLGGDGTLIAAARDTGKLNLPLLGINVGTLGFLADVEIENAESALDLVMNGEYEIEERMMLQGRLNLKNRESPIDGIALNDIVMKMASQVKASEFNLHVNGEFLGCFKSDGMVVCTPTGSTAYSLSAGGPIVDPMAQMLVITPICPHSLYSRSIILSADDKVQLTAMDYNTVCAFDGHEAVDLEPGDYVEIQKSVQSTRIIRTTKSSFLTVLSNKLSGVLY